MVTCQSANQLKTPAKVSKPSKWSLSLVHYATQSWGRLLIWQLSRRQSLTPFTRRVSHKLVMAKWSVLYQWSFKPNCIGKRFITRSFLKRFTMWPSSGLKNEPHLSKCCNSLQLLVSHLVLLPIPCFNLLCKNNGHCQSHSFVSVYCHKNNSNKSNINSWIKSGICQC